MIELMPSPTTPKQWVAPQEIKVSTMISAVVKSGANCGGCWTTRSEVSEANCSGCIDSDARAVAVRVLAAASPAPAS